jgi:hypothetical protein
MGISSDYAVTNEPYVGADPATPGLFMHSRGRRPEERALEDA